MVWVGTMDSIRSCAKGIVSSELIYDYLSFKRVCTGLIRLIAVYFVYYKVFGLITYLVAIRFGLP